MDTSVEAAPAQEQEQAAQPVVEVNEDVIIDDDSELEAAFDRATAPEGQARDDVTGQFKSAEGDEEPEAKAEPESPVEGEGEEAEAEADSSTPETVDVPLPSNWQGMDEAWAKIPDDIRHDIADRENKLHKTLSDQGRQLSSLKPVNDIIQQNANQFAGMTHPDGTPVQAQDAVQYLFNVNQKMTTAPVETILELAQSFGVREQIAAKLNGGQPSEGGNESVLLEKISGLEQRLQALQNPVDIDSRIQTKLEQDRQIRDGEALVSRLSADKPLYAEIPEDDMVTFILKARQTLGDTASEEDVFNDAYDRAVHADPILRAKHAAATKQVAAKADPKKIAGARAANSVNVTSTSSGKSKQLSEDELLEQAYDNSKRN